MLYVWPMKFRRDGKKLKHCYCLRGSAGVEEVDLNENLINDEFRLSEQSHKVLLEEEMAVYQRGDMEIPALQE